MGERRRPGRSRLGLCAWLIAVALLGACGADLDEEGITAGKALAASLVDAVDRRDALRAPHRCARWPAAGDGDGDGKPVGDESLEEGHEEGHKEGHDSGTSADVTLAGELDGPRLRLEHPTSRPLTIAAVADARGDAPGTLEAIAEIREALASEDVDLLLSLGGMGRTGDQLRAVLGALSADAPWLVVALPGDRESIVAHRRAVDELSAEGRAIVDGSAVRLIEMGNATIGTLPGVARAGQLIAGVDGCAHGRSDATDLAAALASRDGIRIWAGYLPPRQHGKAGSDLVDGIHVGEMNLAEALDASAAHAVLHGHVDEGAFGAARGRVKPAADSPLLLATGALEALPAYDGRDAHAGSALILEVRPNRIDWRRVRLSAR